MNLSLNRPHTLNAVQSEPSTPARKAEKTATLSGLRREKYNFSEIAPIVVQLTVSIGFSEKHEGHYLMTTVDAVVKEFASYEKEGVSYEIYLDDWIQHLTLLGLDSTLNQESAIQQALARGEQWENDCWRKIEEKYPGKFTLKRFRDIPPEKLQAAVLKVKSDYESFQWKCATLSRIDTLIKKGAKGKELLEHDPVRETIYVKDEDGKLLYHVSPFLLEKDGHGHIKLPLKTKELSREILSEKISEEDLDVIFNAESSASEQWARIRKNADAICSVINPVKLAIDLTVEEFIARKKMQAHSSWKDGGRVGTDPSLRFDEPAFIEHMQKHFLEYVIMEVAAGTIEWNHVHFEVYPGQRTPALEMLQAIYFQGEKSNGDEPCFEHVAVRFPSIRKKNIEKPVVRFAGIG